MFQKLILICLIIAFSACSTAYGKEHSAPQSKLERCEIDRTTTGIGITLQNIWILQAVFAKMDIRFSLISFTITS